MVCGLAKPLVPNRHKRSFCQSKVAIGLLTYRNIQQITIGSLNIPFGKDSKRERENHVNE